MAESLPSPAPEPWADDAANLPLAFAQVREDPRLDVELAAGLPAGANIAMIASGGETALCLARLPLRHLHLVDINPAQLALTRYKWHLARAVAPEAAAARLGHLSLPAEQRASSLNHWLCAQGLPPDILGAVDAVAALGPDHAGRYERAFARLRQLLTPHAAGWQALLQSTDPAEAAAALAPDTELGASLDAAFGQTFALPNLVCLFGAEATQNPRQRFSEHFAWRTRVAVERVPPAHNPFLWQIFAGCFPPNKWYDWLEIPPHPQAPLLEPVYHHGPMAGVLEGMTAGSLDLVHLSNILDWLSPSAAEVTLQTAARALKKDGKIIIRQLNSTLDIDSIGFGFVWDHALGMAMEERDRSFFYPKIFVGIRP